MDLKEGGKLEVLLGPSSSSPLVFNQENYPGLQCGELGVNKNSSNNELTWANVVRKN